MAGNILTPSALWKNFAVNGVPTFEIIEEKKNKGVLISEIYIHGNAVQNGQVKIHCIWARKTKQSVMPAVVIACDLKTGADKNLAVFLAEKGYCALAVDLGGNVSGENALLKQKYTVYPESLSYANYSKEEELRAEISDDVMKTCWYERGVALRYAIAFLKGQSFVDKVGAIGLFGAATPLWHAMAFEDLACAVIIGNAGWQGYRNIRKFGDTPEPQFSDAALKFLAGIEPQAYAVHVKCPALIFAPTNSALYDMDRAYDTVSRINDKIYTALDYSVGGREEVDYSCWVSALNFLEEFLLNNGNGAELPQTPQIKCTVKDGEIRAEVSADTRGLKEVRVFFAEEEESPCLRAWEDGGTGEPVKDGNFLFRYKPYAKSGKIFVFARAEYKTGTHISSATLCRKFTEEEIGQNGKVRAIFSSRLSQDITGFYESTENTGKTYGIKTEKDNKISVKTSVMDMSGISSEYGITTFKINIAKFKPIDGSMFMLDVCLPQGGNFYVKLITDYFGSKTEYLATVKTFGGTVWQNVKLELNNFKTKEGFALKSYDKIQAMEFSADGEYFINNFLWV